MSQHPQFALEERIYGDTIWVAIRARGADWSWLTREEAVQLGRQWIEQYEAVLNLPASRH